MGNTFPVSECLNHGIPKPIDAIAEKKKKRFIFGIHVHINYLLMVCKFFSKSVDWRNMPFIIKSHDTNKSG